MSFLKFIQLRLQSIVLGHDSSSCV